ncbi:MAG: glycosyltransferase family 1 protein [Patescibacteria group bacterium]
MNIAFEISPLLLASGSFGDKSGVYRYYYGLIKAMGTYVKSNKKNTKIILFSFNKDLLNSPINKDIIDLLNNQSILFIKNIPTIQKYSSFFGLRLLESFLKPFLKIINLILPIKKLYFHIIDELRFQEYISFLKKQLSKYKVTVVYHSETSFYPLKDFKNVITIFDLTPVIMSQYHRFETVDLSKRKLYFAQRHCQGIVCISKCTKDDLLKSYPAFKNKEITICYPGIDSVFLSKHKSNFDDLSQKQICNIKKGRYLLFYSTFEPRKNIINLVQAFFDLHKEKQIPADFKFVLMGGEGWGNIKVNVANFVKENFPIKSKNRILILEYLNDEYLIDLIINSYAVIYPSLYEGFGLPVLESMFLGTPVICSNNSSLPEVGKNSVLYIDPFDYYDLKNKIKHLIKYPKIAQKLGRSGIKQSKKFSWSNSASKLYHFLNTL